MRQTPKVPPDTPTEVVELYKLHVRARKAMGSPPESLDTWAKDRDGLNGYEAVTYWLDLRGRGHHP